MIIPQRLLIYGHRPNQVCLCFVGPAWGFKKQFKFECLYMESALSSLAILCVTAFCFTSSFTLSWICCLPSPWKFFSLQSPGIDCHNERSGQSFIFWETRIHKAKEVWAMNIFVWSGGVIEMACMKFRDSMGGIIKMKMHNSEGPGKRGL